ncbi:MAG: hypothetical protein WD512_05085 [Candidatus Paceibacterota bacterium]
MKVLNLILYSTNIPEYVEMYKILNDYLNTLGIEHYFYIYDENQIEDYCLKKEENILSIKGQETFIPGILEKTLLAFKYFRNTEFDYIVRSNISTVVDFKILLRTLESEIFDYGGPLYYYGSFVDLKSGLTPQKNELYGNRHFVSGICIVLSHKSIDILVDEMEDVLDYGIIDDVAIGIHLCNRDLILKSIVINEGLPAYDFNPTEYKPSLIVYRNNTGDRYYDYGRMSIICSQISKVV